MSFKNDRFIYFRILLKLCFFKNVFVLVTWKVLSMVDNSWKWLLNRQCNNLHHHISIQFLQFCVKVWKKTPTWTCYFIKHTVSNLFKLTKCQMLIVNEISDEKYGHQQIIFPDITDIIWDIWAQGQMGTNLPKTIFALW